MKRSLNETHPKFNNQEHFFKKRLHREMEAVCSFCGQRFRQLSPGLTICNHCHLEIEDMRRERFAS